MEENLKVQFRYGNAIQDKDSVEQQLKVICGDDAVSTDPIDQLAYGKDYILISTRWTLEGIQPHSPILLSGLKRSSRFPNL